MWNSKTFQNFKTSKIFYQIYMGYNVHDVLRRILVYYTRKHNFKKNQFLVMIWNCYQFKNETKNLQGIYLFSKIDIYSKIK